MSARFQVGQRVFIDGRDPQGQPPLTIRHINLWRNCPGERVVGKAHHGSRVRVLERKYHTDEARWYFQVRAGRRCGWLPGDFLSQRREPNIGDWI